MCHCRCVNMADTSHKMSNAKTLREKLTAWDAKYDPKAPLTDKQKDGFMELTTLSANRPLPTELPQDDFPVVVSKLPTSIPNATPNSDTDELAKQFSSLGHDKIENAQQFFTWYSEVEEEMEKDEELQQRQLMGQLQMYRSDCDNVLGEVNQALSHLDHLRERYVAVSTKTNALHEACEHLLAEQTKLVNTAESINNKLAYFNELERISSKLGSPTLTVTSESFVPMLSRLDECIAYLNQNPQYKESSVYMAKFKSCLARALNLIKTHVMNILQNATQNVMPKKDVVSVVDDAFTLFYGKFRTNAPRVKALMEQIEQRVDKSPEYQQLLNDCHQCYFNQRLTLLGPSVSNAVTELATKHVRDHCALMRSGCAFMVHVCEDEHQLFYHFFSKHTPVLEATLESLCNNLYDVFRPLIIHINHLETLAELCSILKVEMIEEHVYNNPQPLVAFETVSSQMLEDVQERLVYRTHIYIRTEILNYNPAQGDLAYPEKLQMMESIAASIKEKNDKKLHSRNSSTASATSIEVANIISTAENGDANDTADENKNINGKVSTGEQRGFVTVPLVSEGTTVGGGNMPMSPADLHGMWYPTVRRTLVCLSKLYRCIDRTTFQGLSQETLSMCIQSLVKASEIISKNKSGTDGQLFLIKHLLILREQIAPFHVDFAVKETALDFSKIKEAAVGLYTKRKKLFTFNSNNAILQFLLEGAPSVTETFIDSKKEVDNQLKKTCEDFIALVTNMLIGPLKTFLDKSTVILEMRKEEAGAKVSLRQQPFASPENLQNVVAQSWKTLKANKSKVQESMALYLANKDTEYILLKPVKANVLHSFQQLQEMMGNEYSQEDQQIIGCPSLEQINLLLSSVPAKS